jgi:hypothetical protein
VEHERLFQFCQPTKSTLPSQRKIGTFVIWDNLRSNWGRGFEFHFEVEMKRKGSESTD